LPGESGVTLSKKLSPQKNYQIIARSNAFHQLCDAVSILLLEVAGNFRNTGAM